MNHNKRIFLAALIGVAVFTSPLFLITPVTGLLVVAFIAALIAVGAVTLVLYWAINRKKELFVTTAAMPIVVGSYAVLNLLYSAVILILQYSGKWDMPIGLFVLGHIIIAGLYSWKLLAADAGKEEIEKVEVKVEQSISNWKMLRVKIANISATADSPVKKSLEKVCDAVRYADPVTSPHLTDIEVEIEKNINLLAQASLAGDIEKTEQLVQNIINQIKQRAELCKNLK
ncbi:MAG: hypothetical protein J6S19_02050 [Lentisphaeria bacterium]|nr:hypothetical protein [Lentisphaeria bacterium]